MALDDEAAHRVVDEAETEYQYARVIERSDGERTLELNEGQAIHSLYRPGTVLTGGYWDGFLVAPFADAARSLGAKLAPILYQLPPNLKADSALLRDFLNAPSAHCFQIHRCGQRNQAFVGADV